MLRCVSKNALGEPVVPEVQDSQGRLIETRDRQIIGSLTQQAQEAGQ
jgi:hypothetical protein